MNAAETTTYHAVGIESVPVTVHVTVDGGIPGTRVIGMRDAQAQEAVQLMRCAIKACGYTVSAQRHVEMTISPDALPDATMVLRPEKAALAMAIAYLQATGQVPRPRVPTVIAGELEPDGFVESGWEDYNAARLAERTGARLVTGKFPIDALPDRLELRSLADLRLEDPFEAPWPTAVAVAANENGYLEPEDEIEKTALLDFSKSVLIIAPEGKPAMEHALWAAGAHTELDDVTRDQTAAIYAKAGMDPTAYLEGRPPTRTPGSWSSIAALVGGGRPVLPGEVSLAHGGTLILEDLQDWTDRQLTAIRSALQEGSVSIVRVSGTTTYPAKFRLIATARPCPCGHFGDREHECTCSAAQVRTYRERLQKAARGLFDETVEI